MREKVYIETSVVSFLCARPARDLVMAAMQQTTHEWWHAHRRRYDCCVSVLVAEEVAEGDAEAAAQRRAAIADIQVLPIDAEVDTLAQALMTGARLPKKVADDAVHIAVASVFGMDYLLTWNCAHIANPHWQARLAAVAQSNGYRLPVLCTPQALIEGV